MAVVTERTVKELISEVLLQAVDDWKALHYGEFRETLYNSGVIHRVELLNFFRSKDFEIMCKYVGISASAARKALNVPMEGGEFVSKPR